MSKKITQTKTTKQPVDSNTLFELIKDSADLPLSHLDKFIKATKKWKRSKSIADRRAERSEESERIFGTIRANAKIKQVKLCETCLEKRRKANLTDAQLFAELYPQYSDEGINEDEKTQK